MEIKKSKDWLWDWHEKEEIKVKGCFSWKTKKISEMLKVSS
jgi:hypothetical protein